MAQSASSSGRSMLLVDTRRAMRLHRGCSAMAIVDLFRSMHIATGISTYHRRAGTAAPERLFGYTAAEAIGQHITLLIPADQPSTKRPASSPACVPANVSTTSKLTAPAQDSARSSRSPHRGKGERYHRRLEIARNITERRQALERQRLLLQEMNHRVKNCFALASASTMLKRAPAQSVKELASAVNERLGALARADAHPTGLYRRRRLDQACSHAPRPAQGRSCRLTDRRTPRAAWRSRG